MKIYSIQILDENQKQIGTSVLTASSTYAIKLKKQWEEETKNNITTKVNVTIWEYDVKTQGKNWGQYACAKKFKE